MPGTPAQTSYAAAPGAIQVFSGVTGAVTAGQVLTEYCCAYGATRIGGLEFNAATAGTGAGNTLLDILVNGVTIWPSGNKPTLAALLTGRFTQSPPATPTLKYGDVVTVTVFSVSTTGHARISGSIALAKQ